MLETLNMLFIMGLTGFVVIFVGLVVFSPDEEKTKDTTSKIILLDGNQHNST